MAEEEDRKEARKRRTSNVPFAQETLKEKQARVTQQKESRRGAISQIHKYFIDYISYHTDLDTGVIEDDIIDSQRYIDIMDDFIQGRTRKVIFLYQEVTESDGVKGKFKRVKHVLVTDGWDIGCNGRCVFFITVKPNLVLTAKTVADDVYFGHLDMRETKASVVRDFERLLRCVYKSALGESDLFKRPGAKVERRLLSILDIFIMYLSSCASNLSNQVLLATLPILEEIEALQSPEECFEYASNSDNVAAVEKLVSLWYKQIEKVLAETEQIRREPDDVGPLAEVDYWRNLSSIFCSLIDQTKSQKVVSALSILKDGNSKLMKPWSEVELKLRDFATEAKDNLKYLFPVELACQSLYNSTPEGMIETIPNLLNVARLVNSVSRYYNNPERLSALFIKVTSQLVTGCKKYVSQDGSVKIWSYSSQELKQRLQTCLEIYKAYQIQFERTLKIIKETPGEKEFGFSQTFIFGKFSAFIKRVNKLLELVEILERFELLGKCGVEGIDKLSRQFEMNFSNFQRKQYDFLDHRKKEFNYDYEDFKKSVRDIEDLLENFLNASIAKCNTAVQTIYLLQRFEGLKMSALNVKDKYQIVFKMLGEELETIKKTYEKEKDDPSLPRGTPPAAGRVMWSRHLFKKMQLPIMELQNRTTLLQTKDGKKLVKFYNAVGKALVQFEMAFHEAWLSQINEVKNVATLLNFWMLDWLMNRDNKLDETDFCYNFGEVIKQIYIDFCLDSPLLVMHPETRDVFINFDSLINQTIREGQCFAKLGLEVPELVKTLIYRQSTINETYTLIKGMVEEIDRLKNMIPAGFRSLMDLSLKKLEAVLQPGFTIMTWSSISLEKFFTDVKKITTVIERFLKQVNDLKSARIDDEFIKIKTTLLVELPEYESIRVDEFLQRTQQRCEALALELDARTHKAEEAVNELIKMVLRESGTPIIYIGDDPIWTMPPIVKKPDDDEQEEEKEEPLSPEMEQIIDECRNLFNFFKNKNMDALVQGTRDSLDAIRKRVQSANLVGTKRAPRKKRRDDLEAAPLFQADITLVLPNLVLQPNVEDIQLSVNKAATMILDVGKKVSVWGQEVKKKLETTSEAEVQEKGVKARNVYKAIVDHKETSKVMMMLSTCVLEIRTDISEIVQSHSIYDYLWMRNREQVIQQFVSQQPTLNEFKEEILRYENLEAEIQKMPLIYRVGAVDLKTDPIKLALSVEAKAWKIQLCRQLHQKYKAKMLEINTFLNDNLKKLARPIKDLEDVRSAMGCLEEIREKYLMIDMDLTPVEEAYGLLQRFQIPIPKEEIDTVDTLRYNFQKITEQSIVVQDELMVVQPAFEKNLKSAVLNFQKNLTVLSEDYETAGPMEEGIPPREASDRMAIFEARFDDAWNRYETCSGGEELFGLEVNDYPHLHKMKKELGLLQKLYGLYNEVNEAADAFGDTLWSDFDVDKITSTLTEFQVRCKKLPKGLKEWQAFIEMKKKIDDLTEIVPLLELMSNKAMKPRHWRRLEALTGFLFDVYSEAFQIKSIICAPLLKYKDEVEDICVSAVKERDIEAKLKQIIFDWSNRNLTFATFKTKGEVLLKAGDMAEIIMLMEDSLMILGSLLTNRYNAPFKKDIQLWVNKLSNSIEIMNDWMTTQNLWIYLEAVFVGGDISKQLPKEAKRFQNIDKSWVKIMARAHEIPNVLACCVGDETLAQLLPHMLEQLEACQKSLTGYLETKRLIFPRFFFISDPALLEILGQASDCHAIQPHLAGIFENVNELEFHEKEYEKILAFRSREKERIPMATPIFAKGNVETWLGTLLVEHCNSINNVIKNGYLNIQQPQFDVIMFINNSAAQVGLLGVQMIWTRDSEIALNNAKTDRKIMNVTNNMWLDLLNKLIEQTTKDLLKFERVKYETLITIHVHQRDIFDDLVKAKIKSILDFEWQKQARFYYDEEINNEIVKITDVNFNYQNEYMGCTDRLVITPLTDRCYITLAQALGMSMGGAPAGPAGTGKTETTKDMGKALGKYVVVFNCSDQMDFRGLGRIYKGLAQSGSWGCFDEFNRIDLPVLSVAAQQIYIVLLAKKEKKASFIFSDGDVVPMNPEFGLFITMNPGYAGRQELPENLKVLFRTVSMMVPDRQIIKRVKLASCGYAENVILAQKFYTLYKLCEEQLTKQVHYDFGLRNILSVLRTMGAAKRSRPNDSEAMVCMRILRDMNLSKLVDEDEPLFRSLISDLFPGIALDSATYPELQAAIASQVAAQGLINHPPWNLKVIQLFEQQRVRHGYMTIGPSGAGKSCCINTLMRALTETGEPTKETRMNPKAITAPQMFGRLDVATNDWTDGIFSVLWRRSHKLKKGEHVWIVLDGPVDAIWIENLNSVLDDNKTLTLANGDRIPMAANCKIVFEPDNIDNASPATVSRNGMVYMSSSFLDWRPILKAWLITRPQQEAHTYQDLFDKSFDDTCKFVLNTLVPKMKILECNYIRQAIDLLQGLMMDKTDNTPFPTVHLERLYVFALMWSLGALLELDDRAKFEAYLRKHPSKLPLPKVPAGQNIFEFVIDKAGIWEHWNNRVQEYIYPADEIPEYSSILIPNVDNVRTNYLIDIIARQTKAVLLIGEQGTAKTVMAKSYMAKYDPEFHISKVMNLSSTTVPIMVQRTIESYVDKRMGTTYGPPGNRKMTVFIDDINMPIINEWGDQVCNEITRQLMECKGFYNLEKPGEFTTIIDMQYIAATIHPGGGRNDVPPRLKRQFCIFNCTFPSNTSIDKIFSVIGCGYFNNIRFDEVIVNCIIHLVPATRILWQQTKMKLLPTPTKFHYSFNLRDLSRIWQGMLNIKRDECNTASTILGLWRHECTRVIADRFITPEDLKWFNDALRKIIRNDLGEEYWEMTPTDPYFADFLRVPISDEEDEGGAEEEEEIPKIYEMVPGFDFLNKVLTKYCRKYNELIKGAKMSLVFFKDCMTHFLKISRIIRTPGGHALLVGVGGSGKQSLSRLSSFVAGYTTFQIVLSRTYSTLNLIDDLKNLYRLAGLKGNGTTFLFTDNEIKDEGFLEYLNNMLSGGEPSSLFARDELDEICAELINAMKREFPKIPPTNDALYEYFVNRSRANLHVILSFSPVGDKFRSRSLKFPGLISGCTMDWFSKWPRDALIAVAEHFLGNYNLITTPEMKAELMNSMGIVHEQVEQVCADYFARFRRAVFVTPKSYLSFIGDYLQLYKDKYDLVGDVAFRMNMGLEKLIEATESVNTLSKELEVKEKELLVASVKVDKVLDEVSRSSAAATSVKNEVQKVKDKAQKIVEGIANEKELAEAKLEAAKPAMADAEAALLTIKAADIATVRKLGKPPHLIMRIMDCVLLLFQKKLDPPVPDPERPCPKPSWGEALKLMSGTGFLSQLQNFNKDTINEEVLELMSPYLEMEDYNFPTAMKVCAQVSGLLSWTIAMAVFFGINKEVLPLKANLIVQEARLTAAMAELNAAQAQLDEKQAELDKVQAMYDGAMKEKQDLLDDAEMCKYKMKTASALINGLSGEKSRWTEQSKTFKTIIDRLIGDVLVLSGFLSYCGPFNQEYRVLLVKGWQKEMKRRGVFFTPELNFIESLTDPATIGEWSLQGLPNDDLSVQNGIITTKSSRYPLLIDPQTQGKMWISNRERQNQLMTTNLSHKYFRTHLEDALSNGRPLLIEDLGEDLDPCLDHILEKHFVKAPGGIFKIKVGDKECESIAGFTLFMTTKLPNPKYSPEIYAKVSTIDFTVTMKGLEDQLLGRVIQMEKPELEIEKKKLLETVTAYKRRMQELEENLLYKLTSTQGSLVEDVSLITVLAITKETAAETKEKLAIAGETEIKTNLSREEFRPVASRGSQLYFLICEMSMVNVMYQTSLKQFLKIFDFSLQFSSKSPVTSKRIAYIIEFMTYEMFKFCCRGLYERDKFLFTMLLTLRIDMQKGRVKHDEFQIFIRGGAALDLNTIIPKPCKWITDITWMNLVELSKLSQFRDITTQVPRSEKLWKQWFDKDAPEEEIIPDGYSTSLDVFRKLLLVRCWCPDRTTSQARKYIADSMGKKYADPVILNMEILHSESDPRTPMICFLSMGSDPTAMIYALATKYGISFEAISMGQGQEIHARRIIGQFIISGGWVLLQNCHLGLDYMPELLDLLTTVPALHNDFRVWITTDVHPLFPISVLQASLKFTNEPPQGLKAGLKRTFIEMKQEHLDYTDYMQWKPMLYMISFLHSTVQERRKYGPLGWNIPYEFNSADYTSSVQFIMNHLDDMDPKRGVSWVTVRYMIAEVQYGGRVTDDYDKRLLNTYAKVWFGDNLLKEDFTVYKEYKAIKCETVDKYLAAIEELPDVDTPFVFGLHTNADITYQTTMAQSLLDTINSIQPKESGGGEGETKESVVFRMADDMLERVPPDYLAHEIRARIERMGALNSLNIFLKQEVDRMQKVISIVRITCSDLKLAIEGTIIMSENLKDALDKIYDAKVPDNWLRLSWRSVSIGFWFTEFLDRNTQFWNWLFVARPVCFWMTGFFNSQGFLTAMRQEVTRMHKGWALDTVSLHNEVTKYFKEELNNQPAEGVYVHGLFLDGASWDRKNCRLIESAPKVLFTMVPVIHIYAINSLAPKDARLYQCPVYKKPNRTDLNFITPLWLKTNMSPDHWILRGVALLCDVK